MPMTEYFKHRAVQDLAWAIRSPPIISGLHAGTDWWDTKRLEQEYQNYLPQLRLLDKSPDKLESALQHKKSHRLGHYFEALIAFWLETTPAYELLLSQFQLRNQHRTLGEIDYLIRDLSTGKVIHLEVAVKFYLGNSGLNNMANWHGPELQDRLDKKFNHLCTHQTQLSRKHPDLTPYAVDEYACIVKGRLYYPPDIQPGTVFTDPHHLHGHWHNYLHDSTEHEAACHQLTKRDWLAPINNISKHQTEALTAIPVEPACCIKHSSGTEQERLFILPEDFWLNVQIHDPAAVLTQQ